nr:hypothetical protein [Tanacetum cinerariifolium]
MASLKFLGPCVFVSKFATSQLVNGSSCDGIDMVIKNLDLESKIDAMMRDFLDPSRWNELSKETSSKILPCGDGSCWKTFKLTEVRRMSILLAPADGIGSKRHHVLPYGELNGITVTLVTRFGGISKSTDRILVFHSGGRKWITKQLT